MNLKSFSFAFAGLRDTFHTEGNFRFHCLAAAVVTGLAFWCRVTAIEAALLAICVAMVLLMELVNTALESAIDLVTDEWQPLAKKAKDAAAAAVLVASIAAVVVGSLILLPR